MAEFYVSYRHTDKYIFYLYIFSLYDVGLYLHWQYLHVLSARKMLRTNLCDEYIWYN